MMQVVDQLLFSFFFDASDSDFVAEIRMEQGFLGRWDIAGRAPGPHVAGRKLEPQNTASARSLD